MEPSSTNCPIASSIFFIICLPRKVQSECFFLPTLSKKYSLLPKGVKTISVVGGYSEGVHLFPFRTEKLSSSALMVLPYGGRVSRRQPKLKRSCINLQGLFFCPYLTNFHNILTPEGSHVSCYLVPGGIRYLIIPFGPWRQHFLLFPFCHYKLDSWMKF